MKQGASRDRIAKLRSIGDRDLERSLLLRTSAVWAVMLQIKMAWRFFHRSFVTLEKVRPRNARRNARVISHVAECVSVLHAHLDRWGW